MISIQNFETEVERLSPMKAEVNFSKIALHQLIEQLYHLLQTECDLDGVFFLKNRSPLMSKSNVSYTTLYKGKEKFEEKLNKQEFKYIRFPSWQFIASHDTIDEIDVAKNLAEPLNFDSDKSFLVSSVRGEKHNWGLLICFAESGIKWSERQKQLLSAFTRLLKNILRSVYEKDKHEQKLEALQLKYNEQKMKIRQLSETLKTMNKDESNRVTKDQAVNKEKRTSCVFNWSKGNDSYDEVWLTLQGYKNGDKDPKLSRWEKISDESILNKINELLLYNLRKSK